MMQHLQMRGETDADIAEVFMARKLITDYLKDRTVTIHYHPTFDELLPAQLGGSGR